MSDPVLDKKTVVVVKKLSPTWYYFNYQLFNNEVL